MEEHRHPIRLIAGDDLERSRPTVFFRVILAIPHLLWLTIWGIAVALVTVVNWFITLSQGQTPLGIHNFVAGYVRYGTHVRAYLLLGANPYPDFGDMTNQGPSYPVDLEIDPPAPQNRWRTGFRIVLAVPAALIGSALGGASGLNIGWSYYSASLGVLIVAAILAWFAILARGTMPRGLSQLIAFALSYEAQLGAYLLLLTDRYPDSDPNRVALPAVAPRRALRLEANPSLERTRLTVFFRWILAIPLIVWGFLWAVATLFAVIFNWFATLFGGRSPDGLHEFIARYLRYATHVNAYLLLLADPYPPFGGRQGTYPVDLQVDPPMPQNRWKTGFRFFLAIPAHALGSALSSAAVISAFLGWFAVMATGRMPRMLQALASFSLAYGVTLYGYEALLTETYPYSGPVFAPEGGEPTTDAAAPAEPPVGS